MRKVAANVATPLRAMSALVLALLYVPKFGQEYLLHFSGAALWNWPKETVLGLGA